jgi:hypothetical protein
MNGIKPFLYLFTDGTRQNSFSAEVGDKVFFRNFKKHLIYTNHLFSQDLVNKHYKDNYQEDEFYVDSVKRYRNIEDEINNFHHFSDAIKVLKLYKEGFGLTSGSVSNSGTVQGTVIHPEEKKILFPVGDKVPVTVFGQWIEFELDKLFNHQPN